MNLQSVLRKAAFAGVFLLGIGASHRASAATLTVDSTADTMTADGQVAVRDSKRDIGAFEANSAPTLVISPQTGSDRVGIKRTFTLVGSDQNGASDIKNMWLLINTLANWNGGATLVYEPSPTVPNSGLLYLRRGGSFLRPLRIGAGANPNAVADNGAVRVVSGDVKVGTVGTRITLTLPLTIRDGLVGQNTLYALITDASGAHDPAQVIDGYRRFGTYTVIPQFRTSVNRVPIVSRLNPLVATTPINAQGLATQTFSFAVKDEDGIGDVESVDFAVGKTLETSTKFVYFPRTRGFSIRVGDSLIQAGNGIPTGYAPVGINGSNTRVVIYPDGKSFGLSIPVVAGTKLLGQNKIWIRAKDLQGATTPNSDAQGFVLSGTWNVTRPTASSAGSALSAGGS